MCVKSCLCNSCYKRMTCSDCVYIPQKVDCSTGLTVCEFCVPSLKLE